MTACFWSMPRSSATFTARRASSLEDARSAGHDLMLDIDVQGAAQVRHTMPEAVSIFVLPPNPKVLRTRLRNRSRAEGQVNESELYRRLSEASKEIENYREYSYILVNDILDRAVAQLEAIVLAERYYRNSEPIALSLPSCAGSGRGLPPVQFAGTAQTRA